MNNKIKLGNLIIFKDFFVGWNFGKFKEYIEKTNILKGAGCSLDELADKLDIPKKKETKGNK